MTISREGRDALSALSALIEADGGTVRVEAREEQVIVRLGGACKGCPGQPFTRTRVVEPLIRVAFGDKVQLRIHQGD